MKLIPTEPVRIRRPVGDTKIPEPEKYFILRQDSSSSMFGVGRMPKMIDPLNTFPIFFWKTNLGRIIGLILRPHPHF